MQSCSGTRFEAGYAIEVLVLGRVKVAHQFLIRRFETPDLVVEQAESSKSGFMSFQRFSELYQRTDWSCFDWRKVLTKKERALLAAKKCIRCEKRFEGGGGRGFRNHTTLSGLPAKYLWLCGQCRKDELKTFG